MMKLNKERGMIALKDVVVLALCGGGLYFVYSKGFLDGYLPEKYASTVVLKQDELSADEAAANRATNAVKPGQGGSLSVSRLDSSAYPQKVKLLKATAFDAIFNGRPAGKVTLEVGSMVKLVEVKEKEVVVEHVGVMKTLPIGDTDTIERIHAIIKMSGSMEAVPSGHQKMRWNKMNEQIK